MRLSAPSRHRTRARAGAAWKSPATNSIPTWLSSRVLFETRRGSRSVSWGASVTRRSRLTRVLRCQKRRTCRRRSGSRSRARRHALHLQATHVPRCRQGGRSGGGCLEHGFESGHALSGAEGLGASGYPEEDGSRADREQRVRTRALD